MSEENFLSDDFIRQLISVGDVDLLIGVPSQNDRETIGKVVQAVEEGMIRNFPRERIALLHVDAGSKDGSSAALHEASSLGKSNGVEYLRTLRWISMDCGSGSANGGMLRTILTAADLLHARGCAVISAATENATPEWIASLLSPIYRQNYDFVAPLYSRHKFDGLLTRNLLYPVCRALYGKPLRELRATEFGFSGNLASQCLAKEGWQNDGLQGSPEMWMAISAMSGGFRCCQTYLGPKARARSQAGVVDTIRHTVSGLFWCLESTESCWSRNLPSEPLHTEGPDHQLTREAVRVDRKKMFEMYKTGVSELSKILETILTAETHQEVLRLSTTEESEFRLANSLWARTIWEFASAYHNSVMNRDHLVQALVPIYRGKVYSFLTQHRSTDAEAMEADLEDLCQEFERQKVLLFERWKPKGQGAQ